MSLYAAFAGVVLIWSTTPLAIQTSLQGQSMTFAVASRIWLGAMVCWCVLRWKRQPFLWHRTAWLKYGAASVGIFGGLSLTYWSAHYIPSGLISVLYGMSPLVTALLSYLLLGERISWIRWGSMLIGVLGLWLVFKGGLTLEADAVKGILGILCALLCFCLSGVLVKRIETPMTGLQTTTGTLTLASLLYLVLWLVLDGQTPVLQLNSALLATLYLAIMGSVFGFIWYYYLLSNWPATKLALVTLITPVFALYIGTALNQEHLNQDVWWGSIVIMSGLLLFQWGVDIQRLSVLCVQRYRIRRAQ